MDCMVEYALTPLAHCVATANSKVVEAVSEPIFLKLKFVLNVVHELLDCLRYCTLYPFDEETAVQLMVKELGCGGSAGNYIYRSNAQIYKCRKWS